MSKARREEVEAAIAEIRAFHAVGRRLREQIAYGTTASKVGQKAEAGDNLSLEMGRKARQFADPILGYSTAQLADVCRFVRNVQPNQEDTKRVFSRHHVLHLLRVQGTLRAKLQTKAVESGWSSRMLEREIKAKQGTRREGGRPPILPTSRAGLLDRLESECERWRRLKMALSPEGGSGRKPAPRAVLGDELMEHYDAASEAVRDFQRAVTDALIVMYPKRDLRTAFREEEETGSTRKGDGGKQSGRKRPK